LKLSELLAQSLERQAANEGRLRFGEPALETSHTIEPPLTHLCRGPKDSQDKDIASDEDDPQDVVAPLADVEQPGEGEQHVEEEEQDPEDSVSEEAIADIERSQKRGYHRHVCSLKRVAADAKEWNGIEEEDLGDIADEREVHSTGARYVFVTDNEGEALQHIKEDVYREGKNGMFFRQKRRQIRDGKYGDRFVYSLLPEREQREWAQFVEESQSLRRRRAV
jgi:hypothetical protein